VCFAFAIPEEFVVIDSWMDRCWWLGKLITAAEQRQSVPYVERGCETPNQYVVLADRRKLIAAWTVRCELHLGGPGFQHV